MSLIHGRPDGQSFVYYLVNWHEYPLGQMLYTNIVHLPAFEAGWDNEKTSFCIKITRSNMNNNTTIGW